MSRRLVVRTALAFACFVVPAVAAPINDTPGAPADQYENFDRTSTIVTDAKTRLVWARVVTQQATFAQTTDACTNRFELGLNRRLPSVKELLTLVDEYPHDVYENGRELKRAIDQQAFDGGQFTTPTNLPYWTSTPAGPGAYWVVDFGTGETRVQKAGGSDFAHVRCVR